MTQTWLASSELPLTCLSDITVSAEVVVVVVVTGVGVGSFSVVFVGCSTLALSLAGVVEAGTTGFDDAAGVVVVVDAGFSLLAVQLLRICSSFSLVLCHMRRSS